MWQPGWWQTTPDVLWQVKCPCGKRPVANVTPRTGAEDGNVTECGLVAGIIMKAGPSSWLMRWLCGPQLWHVDGCFHHVPTLATLVIHIQWHEFGE